MQKKKIWKKMAKDRDIGYKRNSQEEQNDFEKKVSLGMGQISMQEKKETYEGVIKAMIAKDARYPINQRIYGNMIIYENIERESYGSLTDF
jgi:hypothetical protein